MHHFSFKKKKTLSLRVWHWLTGLTILALLFTVFLRNIVLNSKKTASLIETKLSESGIVISEELSKTLAKDIRNPVWEWHFYIGFFLLALALFRLILFLRASEKEINPFNTLKKLSEIPQEIREDARNYAWVRAVYSIFYLNITVAVTTGTLLYFKKSLGLAKEVSSVFKEVHEFNMWFVIAFILIHLAGVVWAEQKSRTKGIVSGMINGGESNT